MSNTEEGRWLEGVGEDEVARQRGESEPPVSPYCACGDPACIRFHDYGWSEPGHLPECPISQHPTRFDSCICDRLRACEARLYTLMGAAIQSAIEAERTRIVFIVEDYYKVAPKAAEKLLSLINEEDS